jgi:hypothetical protein
MSDQAASPPSHKAQQARRQTEREARRKAELKANMARRKAQMRARGDVAGGDLGDDALASHDLPPPDCDSQSPQDDTAQVLGGQNTNSEIAKR